SQVCPFSALSARFFSILIVVRQSSARSVKLPCSPPRALPSPKWEAPAVRVAANAVARAEAPWAVPGRAAAAPAPDAAAAPACQESPDWGWVARDPTTYAMATHAMAGV